jgi:hypothetical protein
MGMRMENDLCSAADRPPDGFGIAPALMTNHNAKCQRPNGKYTSASPHRWVDVFLGGVKLSLVLPTCDRAVGLKYAGCYLQTAIRYSLGAKNDRHAGSASGFRNYGPSSI